MQIKKFVHKPSINQIFHCLESMQCWSNILLANQTAPYSEFLKWLLDRKFFEEREERILINKLARDFGADAVKVTKWLSQIYNDILDLNYEHPELFKTEGKMHEIDFTYFDSYGFMNVWLLSTPRLHERFSFFFIEAKLGSSSFYVNEVYHKVSKGEHTIRISLSGEILNRYREGLIERAKFEGLIGYWREKGTSLDIDDKLRKWYK